LFRLLPNAIERRDFSFEAALAGHAWQFS
jgi:hypothetical protein